LKLSDFEKLESVKATYLKRAMSVSKFSQSRLVYLLANCSFFVCDLQAKFKLPITVEYQKFIMSRNEKFGDIDTEFLATHAMTTDKWKLPYQKDRHVFTRFAVHGFHHLVCKNPSYHFKDEKCVCKLCDEKQCGTHHIIKCTKRVKSLVDYATEN
jgi:hypothetical protein